MKKKPRNLLYNIASSSCSHIGKLLVTTAMGGDIHMWNCGTRSHVTTVHKKDFKIKAWAEDIYWATHDILAVAVKKQESHID